MDRITLVGLIEGEVARLSSRCRELWEEMEPLVELSPEDPGTLAEQVQRADIVNRMAADLPQPERDTIDRLLMLYEGLLASDEAEKRGESGEGRRDRYGILAAGLKDRSEGRQVDPDMTVEQAIARLRQ